jgi:putative FmdB family regulatory protein
MPMFEFICRKCSEEFEELVFSSHETVDCPSCGSDDVTKKVSVVAFKSSGRFVASSGSSCSGCTPGPSGCSGCSH